MSVLVEIYKIPEPAEKQAKVLSFSNYNEIPFMDEDFLRNSMDLNTLVEGNKGVTFYARVTGNCSGSQYQEGDILVVDRLWPLQHNKMAVCYRQGTFQVMRIKLRENGIWLEAINQTKDAVLLDEDKQWEVWGMVTYEVKRVW